MTTLAELEDAVLDFVQSFERHNEEAVLSTIVAEIEGDSVRFKFTIETEGDYT